MAIVYGFGGLRLKEQGLYFAPYLPRPWTAYRFKIQYRQTHILIEVTKTGVVFTRLSGEEKTLHVYGKEYLLQDTLTVTAG
jgi:alpha,alpha-trehalose phosphorylase